MVNRYVVMVVCPRHPPMTQQTGPRQAVIVVTDTITGRTVAIDYLKSNHKNKMEAIRILKEQDEVND